MKLGKVLLVFAYLLSLYLCVFTYAHVVLKIKPLCFIMDFTLWLIQAGISMNRILIKIKTEVLSINFYLALNFANNFDI